MAALSIKFARSANSSVVSAYSRRVLMEILGVSGCDSCTITSTSRTPEQQARAMYNNIVTLGVVKQLSLYAPAGDLIIREYVNAKKAGLAPASIVAAMAAKVVEIGPSRVSLHCADPATVNVLDVAPSSIADPPAFLAALVDAKKHGMVSRYFSPGSHDPAFHVEIPQA